MGADVAAAVDIVANVAVIRERIARSAAAAGRDPATVTLVAVTKTQPLDRIAAVRACGITDFGENRVQEALTHFAEPLGAGVAANGLPRTGIQLHLIGPLQRNKARRAALFFDSIQTVDRLDLAQALDRHRATDAPAAAPLPVLIEVNISGEAGKSGVAPVDVAALADGLRACPYLAPQGLLTVGAPGLTEAAARRQFAALRALRSALAAAHPDLAWPTLSMGMSADFEAAIREGATQVRLGRVLFGARDGTL